MGVRRAIRRPSMRRRSSPPRSRPRSRRTARRSAARNRPSVAIGLRVARRDASTPTRSHITTDAPMAIGYRSLSPNGAPTTSRPGAANTPAIRPTAPLQAVSNSSNDSQATAPTIPGTISAANGPSVRMRLRYQRGPSMSGADVTRPAPDGGRRSGRRVGVGGRRARWQRWGVRIHNVHSVRRRPQPRPAPPVTPVGAPATSLARAERCGGRGARRSSRSSGCGPDRSPRQRCRALVLAMVMEMVPGRTGAASASNRRILVLLAVVLATFGAIRSDHAWNGLAPDRPRAVSRVGPPDRRSAVLPGWHQSRVRHRRRAIRDVVSRAVTAATDRRPGTAATGCS